MMIIILIMNKFVQYGLILSAYTKALYKRQVLNNDQIRIYNFLFIVQNVENMYLPKRYFKNGMLHNDRMMTFNNVLTNTYVYMASESKTST